MCTCAHEGCGTVPSYGVEGSRKATMCAKHAEQGMVNVVAKKCKRQGCLKRPSYGFPGSGQIAFCAPHAEDGMVNLVFNKCSREGCNRRRTHGFRGQKAGFCDKHAEAGMIDVTTRKCTQDGCAKHAKYGIDASSAPEFCHAHFRAGMVNVVCPRCVHENCSNEPHFGEEGNKSPLLCAAHALPGMINLTSKTSAQYAPPGTSNTRRKICENDRCSRLAKYGHEGQSSPSSCFLHAEKGMVNVVARKCAHDGCSMRPTFGLEGSKRAEYCSNHADTTRMVPMAGFTCAEAGCHKQPSYGIKGTTKSIFCRPHAVPGMVYVKRPSCAQEGCRKLPKFGVEGSKVPSFCDAHGDAMRMVVIGRNICAQDGCHKRPSYGVEGTARAIFCAPHAAPGMTNVTTRKCRYAGCPKQVSYHGIAKDSKPQYCAIHRQSNILGSRPDTHGNQAKECAQESCYAPQAVGSERGPRAKFSPKHAPHGPSEAADSLVVLADDANREMVIDVGDESPRAGGKRPRGSGEESDDAPATCEVARCQQRAIWGPWEGFLTRCKDHSRDVILHAVARDGSTGGSRRIDDAISLSPGPTASRNPKERDELLDQILP